MKIRLFLLLALYALTVLSCSNKRTESVASGNPNFKIIGYYANFENKRPVNMVNFKGLTQINHVVLYPDTSKMFYRKVKDEEIKALIARSKDDTFKVFVVITMDSFSLKNFQRISADIVLTKKLAYSLDTFCKKYGYDGVDLDWVSPEEGDKYNYTQFVEILSDSLHKNKLEFSCTLPHWYNEIYFLELEKISRSVDWINILMYNYGDRAICYCNHNTPMKPIEKDLKLFIDRIPKKQLVFGLAFYGWRYKYVDNFKIGATGLRDKGPYYIDSILIHLSDTSNWEKVEDKIEKVPYIFNKRLHQFISYDDTASIAYKCKLVKSKKLGGLIFWAIDYDASKPYNSLQEKVFEELR
jgi:chitinase